MQGCWRGGGAHAAVVRTGLRERRFGGKVVGSKLKVYQLELVR
jgi:hypothetical protein